LAKEYLASTDQENAIMPATNEEKRPRAEREYQFLATLLRNPEKLPLVIGRLDPARFDVPIIAQIVKALIAPSNGEGVKTA
jgi:hypothetical protein